MPQFELALDGIVPILAVQRNLSSSLGGSTCTIKLERDYAEALTRKCQLASVVLSPATNAPLKYFTGWCAGYAVQPDGEIDEYAITLRDVLLFEDCKLIPRYQRRATVKDIAVDLLTLSGAGELLRNLRLFDLDVIRTGERATVDPVIDPEVTTVNFVVEKDETLSSALARLASENGYEISTRERGWLSIAALQNTNGAIADLVLRKRGVKAIPAPRAEMIVDPTNHCDDWWEGEVSYNGEWPLWSGVLLIGANGDAVPDNGGVSLTEEFSFPVLRPQPRYPITTTATRLRSAVLTPNEGCTDRIINLFAGGGATGFTYGIPATDASLSSQQFIAIDSTGKVYWDQNVDNLILKVNPADNLLQRWAGNISLSNFPATPGLATSTAIGTPSGLDTDASNNLYVGSFGHAFVYKIDSSGILSHFAGSTGGTNWAPPFTPASATSVLFQGRPGTLAVDKTTGNLYLSCNPNFSPSIPSTLNLIAGGIISNLLRGDVTPDVDFIRDMAVSPAGTLHLSLGSRNKIVKYVGGVFVDVAGTGTAGFSGDEGPATSARLSSPGGICFDGNGNLIIADAGNRRIRLVDAAGNISTIAGTGASGDTGDGDMAINATFRDPQDVVAIGDTIYVLDNGSTKKIRVITC